MTIFVRRKMQHMLVMYAYRNGRKPVKYLFSVIKIYLHYKIRKTEKRKKKAIVTK